MLTQLLNASQYTRNANFDRSRVFCSVGSSLGQVSPPTCRTLIYERVRDFVLAQQIEEFSRKPLLVADLNCEAITLGELFQEWFKSRRKFLPGLEGRFVEIAELEKKRAELVAHQVHRFEKMF